MGRRFILRNDAGTLCGYLLQDDEGIRCRASLMQKADLIVLNGEEPAAQYALEGSSSECFFPLRSAKITGGYIADERSLLMATDDAARQAWARKMMEQKVVQNRNESKTREIRSRKPDLPDKEGDSCTHSVMQRRWPPPPCMPGARYIRGEWVNRL